MTKQPERREFEMTHTDLTTFRIACTPATTLGIVSGLHVKTVDQASREFWKGLAERWNFKWWTVAPHPTKGERWFTAVIRETN